MNKKLVAYFSCTGRTKKVAEAVARSFDAEIYEIKPEVKYTKADLNWNDSKSRTTIEMENKSMRPAIIKGDIDVSGFDTVYLCFPIWWYVAPTVINAFLESCDFSGKKIYLIATSGTSGFGDTVKELAPSAPNSEFKQTKVLSGMITDAKISAAIELCK